MDSEKIIRKTSQNFMQNFPKILAISKNLDKTWKVINLGTICKFLIKIVKWRKICKFSRKIKENFEILQQDSKKKTQKKYNVNFREILKVERNFHKKTLAKFWINLYEIIGTVHDCRSANVVEIRNIRNVNTELLNGKIVIFKSL